jgi:hypothetical protein
MNMTMSAKSSPLSRLGRALALLSCAALCGCNFLRNEFLALDRSAPQKAPQTGVDSHP